MNLLHFFKSLLLCAFVFCFVGQNYAQDKPPVRVEGKITNFITGTSVSGATIEVYKNGTLAETKNTSSNGKYKLTNLALDNKYKIVISCPGMVSRFVEIDLTGIPNEDIFDKGWDIPVDMPLLERVPNIDFSSLEPKRTSVIKHNKSSGALDWNTSEIESYKKEQEKLLKKLEVEKQKQDADKQAQEKKYTDALAAAEDAMKKKDYQAAINKYQEAKAAKPSEAATLDKKLEIANQEYKKFQGEQALEKEYLEFMKAGDDKVKAGDFDNAIASYKQALTKKPNDAAANQKIKDAEAAKKNGVDKQYTDLLARADKAFKEKDYAQAKNYYKEAGTIKPAEALPKQKVQEIDDLIKKGMENETKYNEFIANGNKSLVGNKFDDAINNFNEALKIRPGDAEATTGLANAKKAKETAEKEVASQAAKKKEFDDLVLAADKEFAAKNYEAAIKKYDEALAKFDDANVKKKKFDAEAAKKKLDEENAAKAANELKKKEYDKFMGEGNTALAAKSYEEAIAKYKAALATGFNDLEAQKKVVEAEAAKAGADASAKKKTEFDAFIASGDGKLTGKEFDNAIAEYTKALALKVDDAAANKKITDAKTAKAAYDKEQADKAAADAATKKKQEFDAFITAGDGKLTGKEFDNAIAEYTKALALKVDDAAANKKIADAKTAKTAYEKEQADKAAADAANKKKTEFDAFIAAGDGKLTGKEFDNAIAEYTKALALKVDDAAANKKIAEAKTAKTAYEKEQADKAAADAANKKKQEFDAFIAAGDGKLTGKEFDNAIAEYKKALALKLDDALVNTKIKEATDAKAAFEKEKADKLAAEADAKQKKKLYDETILKAQKDFDAGEFQAAIDKYNTALTYVPDDAFAKGQIEKAKQKLKEKQDFAEQQLQKLLEQADKDFAAGNFADAKGYYERYVKQRPDNTYAQNRVKECDDKIKEQALNAEQAKKKAEFDALITAGDGKVTTKEFDKAIEEYKKALATKFDDTKANTKIKEATDAKIAYEKELAEKLKNEAEAKKKQEFDAFIAAGDGKVSGKEFDNAIAEYKKALAIKYDDAAANAKIKEATDAKIAYEKEQADKAAADAATKRKQEFDAFIAAGDGKISAKDFDKGLEEYKKALALKVDDAAANQKITDAIAAKEQWLKEQLAVADKAKNKKLYDETILKAQKDFDAGEFLAAIDKYNTALTYVPDDAFAKGQIEKAQQKLKEKQDFAEQQLQKLLEQADKDFAAGNFADAKGYYERYVKQRPDNTYAQNRIKECDDKIKEANANALAQAQIEAKYKDFMTKGETAFKAKKFDEAIAMYDGALGVKAGDADATTKKDLAIKAKQDLASAAENAVLKKKYDEAVKKANAKFDAGDFKASIDDYTEALNYIPNDKFATDRIALANERMNAKAKEAEDMLNKLLMAADNEFNDKNWTDAKGYYERYLKLRPDNTYAQGRLKECEDNLKADMANAANKAALEAKYKKYMEDGEKSAATRSYDDAIKQFTSALDVKPGDATAQKRIADINKLKDDLFKMANQKAAEKENQAKYDAAIADGNAQLSGSNFDPAIEAYKLALTYKPNDKFATDQIKRCIKLREQKKSEMEAMYTSIIKKADELFEAKNYGEAKTYYERAQNMRSMDPYPPQRIEECDKMLNKIANANKDYTLEHSGTIVVDQTVLEGQKLLEEAKRQEKYMAEQEYVEINSNQQQFVSDKSTNQLDVTLAKQKEFNAEQDARSDLYRDKDNIRLEKVDSTREYIDYRDATYRGKHHEDILEGYNRQQKFNQEAFETEGMFREKDKIHMDKADSVKMYKDYKEYMQQQANKNNDDQNYNLQARYNEEAFQRERMYEAKDGMREYKADSVKFYKDYKEEMQQQANKNHDDRNYNLQAKYNEEAFQRERLYESKDGMREYKADSMKFYKDYKEQMQQQANKNHDDRNYNLQAKYNEEAFQRERLYESKDGMREYKADSMKFYKDYKEQMQQQANKNHDDRNYNLQAKYNEEAFQRERLYESKDDMREYKADSMKFYKDYKEQMQQQANKNHDDKNYNLQANYNDDAFKREQMYKDKDNKLRGETIKETQAILDNNQQFLANASHGNIVSTTENNNNLIKDAENRSKAQSDGTDRYLDGADEFVKKNDDNSKNISNYSKTGDAQVRENNEKFKTTSPVVPKNYDNGHLAQLAVDYGPGIHQWTTNKYNGNKVVTEVIVRRIVVKGNTANDYMMTQSRWGIAYTRNGQTIGEHVWTVETGGEVIVHDK